MLCCLLHLVVAIPLFLSSLPIPKPLSRSLQPYHLHFAQVASHALLGLLLIVTPSWLLSFTVEGEYKSLHLLMQSYVGVFHLAVAAFVFHQGEGKQPRPFVFARALSAFFVLFTKLFAAWHLSEKSTRGLLISDDFVWSSLLLDGAWLGAEVVRFLRSEDSDEDKINDLCAVTTRWAEGKGSRYLENALYADAAIAFAYALFHFAFPTNILKLVIRSNIELDSHHYMWCRLFGALWLQPALTSFAAVHSVSHHQLSHLLSRLVIQVGLFTLHVWGHWIDPVYSINHISAFMVAGFFMSFHISLFYRFFKLYQHEPKTRVSARVEIKKTK